MMKKNLQPLTKKDLVQELQKAKRIVVECIHESYLTIVKDFREALRPVKKLLQIVETFHQKMSLLEKDLTEQITKTRILEKRLEKLERLQKMN